MATGISSRTVGITAGLIDDAFALCTTGFGGFAATTDFVETTDLAATIGFEATTDFAASTAFAPPSCRIVVFADFAAAETFADLLDTIVDDSQLTE